MKHCNCVEKPPPNYRDNSLGGRSFKSAGTQSYQIENKGDNLMFVVDFGLRKSLLQSRISVVRRFFGFLQYGTSARLAAPLICMPAPEYALPRHSRVRINGTLTCLEESSLRRVRFRSIGIRTGWSRNPSSSGSTGCGLYLEPALTMTAEGHRVRRRSIQSLRALRSHGVFQ